MHSREKNQNWTITQNASGTYSYEAAQIAVLQDLRDELQKLNTLLHCHNFVGIPQTLRSIKRSVARIPVKRKRIKK